VSPRPVRPHASPLGPRAARALRGLFARPVLLAFDFDGTLAPIVRAPGEARMRARTATLFAALCARTPCAVISGRDAADVSTRLAGAAPKYVVGNHGIELASGEALVAYARAIRAAADSVTSALRGAPGFELEQKPYSLALHYRRASALGSARRRARAALTSLGPGFRVVPGKHVFNVVPAAAPHKGDALIALCAREGATSALFAGDDYTDEDAFRASVRLGAFSVRIGCARPTTARFRLLRQRDVDRLLLKLLAAAGTTPGP
jgi:trehalose 6-phosphate phosphatase